jgi:hypothetical protein
VRRLLPVVVLLGFAVLGYAQEPRGKDPSTWVEVYPNHFEVNGAVYMTQADLEPVLRNLSNKKVLVLHWSANADDKARKDAIAVKLREAEQAAKEAGIAKISVISNEVF